MVELGYESRQFGFRAGAFRHYSVINEVLGRVGIGFFKLVQVLQV